MPEAWYCKAFGQELGPMSFDDLVELVERGDVVPSDEVKCGPSGAWGPAGRQSRLFSASGSSNCDAEAGAGNSKAGPQVAVSVASDPIGRALAAEASPPDESPAYGTVEASTSGLATSEADATAQSQAESSSAAPPAMASGDAPRRANRALIFAAAAALAICGGATGAGAKLFLGNRAAAPAPAVSAGAVDQQKIAMLRQEIDDLKRQREELASASTAPAPNLPPASPPAAPSSADSPSAPQGPPDDAPAKMPPPPARSAEPANAKAPGAEAAKSSTDKESPPGDSPEPPPSPATAKQSQDGGAAGNAAAMKASGSAPPPSKSPPVGAANAAAAAGAGQNGVDAVSQYMQGQERRRQRWELLRQIYSQRAELLIEIAGLEAEAEKLASAIAATETAYAETNATGQGVLAALGLAQTMTVRDPDRIQDLMEGYALLERHAAALKVQRQQQAAEEAELMAKIKKVRDRADQLRSSWLAVVDPFGHLDQGDEETALTAFTEWTTLEPKNPGPWLARGFAYWQLKRFDDALKDFDVAVKLAGPMLSNSLAVHGGLLHAVGRSKEAMAEFGKALKFNKADGMVYLFRGRAMCAEEKFTSAVKDFKTAIQLNAKDAEAHRNLALVLAACPKDRYRNGKRAVESAKQACELTEWKSWTALDTLAAAYAEAGDYDQARRWAEKAADLSYGANRDQCLARLKQYEARQPLRLDWKSNYGNLSAASESPISK